MVVLLKKYENLVLLRILLSASENLESAVLQRPFAVVTVWNIKGFVGYCALMFSFSLVGTSPFLDLLQL